MKRLILGLVLVFPVGPFGAAPAACNGQGASPGTYDAVHVAYGNVEITATVFQPVVPAPEVSSRARRSATC
jgi:hypothetical protein